MKIKKHYIIPLEKAESIFREAKEIARKWWIDELDCSKSFSRQPSQKTFEEMMEICKDDNIKKHLTYIYRDQYFLPQNEYFDDDGKDINRNYWDIGFITICLKPDHFLWIELEEEDGEKLIDKYQLLPYDWS